MRARPLVRRAVHAASAAAAAALLTCGISVGLAGPTHAQTSDAWDQYQQNAARTGVTSDAPPPPYAVTWETAVDLGAPADVSGFPVPIVVGDLAVVVGPESVVAIDVNDGTQAWSVDRALGPSVPAAAAETPDGMVIVVTEGGGEGDASSTPTTPTDATPSGSVTPSASSVPPVDLDTTSVLLGLDAETGARRWEHALPALSRTGAAVVGGQAFVGTDEGDVIRRGRRHRRRALVGGSGGRGPLAARRHERPRARANDAQRRERIVGSRRSRRWRGRRGLAFRAADRRLDRGLAGRRCGRGVRGPERSDGRLARPVDGTDLVVGLDRVSGRVHAGRLRGPGRCHRWSRRGLRLGYRRRRATVGLRPQPEHLRPARRRPTHRGGPVPGGPR